MELEFPQIEGSEMLKELSFLVRRHQVGAVLKSRREAVQETELNRNHLRALTGFAENAAADGPFLSNARLLYWLALGVHMGATGDE
jgi:hypothetical protein